MKRALSQVSTPGTYGDSGDENNNDSAGSPTSSTAGDQVIPFESYEDVHTTMLSLKDLCNDHDVRKVARRAMVTLRTIELQIAIRQLVVRLATHLCTCPGANSIKILTGLVGALSSSEPAVRCEIYQAMVNLHELKDIFRSEQLPENIHGTLSGALLGDLNHTQHHLRCAVLAVIPIVRPHGIESDSAVFDTICRYSMDAHPKVRQQALSIILQQHLAGIELPVEMYDECVVATKDDFEQVRLVAVELLWTISSVHPEHPVVIHKYKVTETIRLLDDAFVKLCDMVNDSSTVVRQRACSILGRFKNVDIKFLSQTFSKQVMSHLRRYVPRGPRNRGRNRSAKGQPAQSHIPTPEGDVDVESDEFRLLDSGAAGAFVHGLEDEFQEVRDAAIESITELSGASSEFAGKAVDFLIDMFNDSSDRVRQCAIRALLAIGTRTPLNLTEEQMLIAVSAMKDASSTVRHGIYGVLGVSLLDKAEWMETLMTAFKANLERYPDDQMPIYKALQALGRRHPTIIASHEVVRSLLGISKDYLNRESRLDDIYYAGVVILIMNAPLDARLALHRVLPEFVYSHLPYLRDKYPDSMPYDLIECVPSRYPFVKQMLRRPHKVASISMLASEDYKAELAAGVEGLSKCLSQISNRSAHADVPAEQLSHRINELKKCAKQGRLPVADDLAVSYAQIIVDTLLAKSLAGNTLRRTESLGLAAQIMRQAYKLECTTLGLTPRNRLALVYLRLFAHAVWASALSVSGCARRVVGLLRSDLQHRAQRTTDHLLRAGLEFPELARLLRDLEADVYGERTDSPDEAWPLPVAALATFISDYTPLAFLVHGQCQRTNAAFTSTAAASMRRTLEFNHMFPVDLPFSASFEWLAHRQQIVVSVRLPTQQTVSHVPPMEAFVPKSQLHWQMHWQVPVLLPLGSGEETAVELNVAMRCAADVPVWDAMVVGGQDLPSTFAAEDYFRLAGDDTEQFVSVEISKEPLRIGVNPVQFKPPATAQTRI
ncbi:hypothetical protein FBU59_001149 [Linderina macrospora]|uniref:Uncharacterized protein n=1 Tax=Linderina macrospora TaxID=4868 RepID=A0ACC1JET2_9FUNG|nr:hypothetical protein FBU59_001149 [Linderina macrospora]